MPASFTTATGDGTYWMYDAASGALTNKTDAQGKSVVYAYDPSTGWLATRSWARLTGGIPVTVTNAYNWFGDLVGQQYDDGTASVQYNNYNHAGQPREIVEGAGTNELTYDFARRLNATCYATGPLAGVTVSNHFNPHYGRDSVAVLGLSAALEDDYGYDTQGRLSTVASGVYSAGYGYLPNSDLLQTTTCYSNLTTVLTTTRTWDYGMRLRSINNVVGGATVTSHSYQYDALDRRTLATLEDGSSWQYGYDDRDELTSADRHWASWQYNAPVAGQQYSYAYDNIGNRSTAAFGGDTNGASLRTITYTNNSLNEYAGILTPSYDNVIGAALATTTVTVNGSLADREAEYFHRELAVPGNGTNAVWQMVTNISGTFTNQGGLLVPPASDILTYDADGNLTFDGIWIYQWDGENRLVAMTMTNVIGIANSNRLQLCFAYDYMGRRTQKLVSSWSGSSYANSVTNLYIYDAKSLIAVINPQLIIQQTFVWGSDLSGTFTDDGGVGGLLMACMAGTNCFTLYDGNGNITSLVNATDKTIAARYEYSPYGEILRQTGLLSVQNPFRFSTKFWDGESAFILYGYRYYNPAVGKWISRDPTEECYGLNLTEFVGNNPANSLDGDGRLSVPSIFYPGPWNIHDHRDTYDTFDTSAVTAEIRSDIDRFNIPSEDTMVYGFVASNFHTGGNLDYSWLDNNVYGPTQRYKFDGAMMTGHQFANNLAGYAAGYASYQCEDVGFDSIMSVASLADGVRDKLSPTGSANMVAGLCDVFNGIIIGTMDSLFGSDDN